MTSASRLGPRGLAQLQQRLSDRDLAVLRDVDSHRLLSGRQLQQLHFGNDAAAARASARTLLRLSRARLLVRLERRIGGVRAGSSGFVYSLGQSGARLLHPDQALARRADVSDGFLLHTLGISDLYVQLTLASRRGDLELVDVQPEPRCWRRFDSLSGSDWLKPDLFVMTASADQEWLSFVEWDTGSEHRPALLRKLRQYEAAFRAGQEQARHGVFPRVVWLVPDGRRAKLLRQLIRSSSNVTAELHAVGLTSDGIALLSGGLPPNDGPRDSTN